MAALENPRLEAIETGATQPPPWRVVSPEGVMYYLHDRRGLLDLAEDKSIKPLLVRYVSTVSEVEPDTAVEYVSERIWTTHP